MLRSLFFFLLIAAAGYGKHKPSVKSKSKPSNSSAMCSSAAWSDSDRQGILNVHNTLRSSIAEGTYVARRDHKPPATDMEEMVYDCSLEASAQAWADTCPTGHSHAAGKGENLYWSYSSTPIPITGQGAEASKDWENEFQQYGWPSNILTSSHATQMAWWSSNHVGCGVKQCPSSMRGYKYEIVVACQYTPQGNILNQPIYQSGTTCSACSKGMTCDQTTGLCK